MKNDDITNPESERCLRMVYDALGSRGMGEVVPLSEDSIKVEPLLHALDEGLGRGWIIFISSKFLVTADQVVAFENQGGEIQREAARVITLFIRHMGLDPLEVWYDAKIGERLDSESLPKHLKDAVARRNRMVELAARK